MNRKMLMDSVEENIICYHGGMLRISQEGDFFCDCSKPFTGKQCEYDIRNLDQNDSTFAKNFIDIIICIFFLLLLPSLILYCIRVLYLFLKRWGQASKEVAITVLPQPLPEVNVTTPELSQHHSMYRTISLPPEIMRKSPSICIIHKTHSLNPRRARKTKSRRHFVYYGVIDGPMEERSGQEEMPPAYDIATTREIV